MVAAQKRFHIFDFDKGYGLVKDYTRLNVTMTQSLAAAEEWQESVSVGYVAALTFCAIMVLCFCIAPNCYHLGRHCKRNKSLRTAEFQNACNHDKFKRSFMSKAEQPGRNQYGSDDNSLMQSATSEHPVDLKSTLGTVSGPEAAKRYVGSPAQSYSTKDKLMLGGDLADNKSMKKSLYESRVTYKYQNNGGVAASEVRTS